jgi:hypothetical protein
MSSMADFLDLWPIISAVAILFAMIISFKSEVLIRLQHLEEKIKDLFSLWNSKGK